MDKDASKPDMLDLIDSKYHTSIEEVEGRSSVGEVSVVCLTHPGIKTNSTMPISPIQIYSRLKNYEKDVLYAANFVS